MWRDSRHIGGHHPTLVGWLVVLQNNRVCGVIACLSFRLLGATFPQANTKDATKVIPSTTLQHVEAQDKYAIAPQRPTHHSTKEGYIYTPHLWSDRRAREGRPGYHATSVGWFALGGALKDFVGAWNRVSSLKCIHRSDYINVSHKRYILIVVDTIFDYRFQFGLPGKCL